MRPARSRALAPALLSILSILCTPAAAAAGGGGSATPPPPPPTLLLHLSDLHFPSPPRAALGDAGADLGALGSALRHSNPAGLIITGDLTHAKSPSGASRQAQPEWRAYRRAVNALSAGLGWTDLALAADRLLDVRGNHDAFAVPSRGGPSDEFPSWAGEGRRSPGGRVFIAAASHDGIARKGPAACPAACLLGVDATPNPGPAGANNFAGWVGDDGALDGAVRAAARGCLDDAAAACEAASLPLPALLAYGHYPLSTVARPLPRAGPPPSRPPSLATTISTTGASAYLSGHLHAVFGDRLHRLLARPDGGSLAEVVTAAWATERAVRLVAVDGGIVSFVDLRMRGGPGEATRKKGEAKPPSPSLTFAGVGAGVAAAPGEGSASVGSHALLITSPGDGRYGAAMTAPGAAVRVLAIPVCSSPDPESPCRPDPPSGGVSVGLTCRPSGATPPPVTLSRPDADASPLLWEGTLGGDSLCLPGDTSVELRATNGDWGSSSPTAVVWLEGKSPRPPLTTTPLAAWAVSTDWQAAARSAFYGLWAAHFIGALLVPRMAGASGAAAALEAAAARAPGGRVGRSLAAWLLWPASALCDNAAATGPFLAQLLYALYLLIGPWGVVTPFGPAAPGVRALYGPSGFRWLGSGPPGHASPSLYVPDAVRVGALHLLGAVAPCTAWIAAAVGARASAARARRARLTLATKGGLVLGGAASASTSAAFAYRFAWQLGGWSAIAASPGLTWTWPLAAGVVQWVLS